VNSREILEKIFEGKLKNEGDLSKAIRILDRRGKNEAGRIRYGDERADNKPSGSALFRRMKEINKILVNLKKLGITNVRFDSTLARGFDYYTGMVFEIIRYKSRKSQSAFWWWTI